MTLFPVKPNDFSHVFGPHPLFGAMLSYEDEHAYGILADAAAVIEVTDGNEDAFLSPGEKNRWKTIGSKSYRNLWLTGRVCASILWARCAAGIDIVPWAELETISRNADGRGIRPQIFHCGNLVDRDLSISHTLELVLVLLAKRSGLRVACDIVAAGTVSETVSQRFFLPSEQELHRDQVWAVKETAYKAMHENQSYMPLRWSTRNVGGNTFSCIDLDFGGNRSMSIETYCYRDHVIAVGGREERQKPERKATQ